MALKSFVDPTKSLRNAALLLTALVALSGCAKVGKMVGLGQAPAAAPVGNASRAQIETSGKPVMRLRVPSRGIDTFLTIRDRRGDYVNWFTADGILFTFRDNVLIETRGLGADLMSSAAPTRGQITAGSSHRRSYFFVDADDQTGRRDYSCRLETLSSEPVVIFQRQHATREIRETCERDIGRISNRYWVEGGTIRKSLEWVSPGIGQVEFERVVD